MTRASIAEIKSHLDRYLSLVRKGTVVQIVVGDAPVAEIVPIARPARDRRGDLPLLERLVEKGVLRKGTGRVDDELLDREPAGSPAGVLQALLDEREGR